MKRIILAFGLNWLFGASISFASGIIIPEPPKGGELYPQPLSVKTHTMNITIDNQIARTEVDQVFVNPLNQDLEGTYFFPIPEGASISRFSLWVGGEELKGEILDKNEAKRIYEDIVSKMKDPGLLEFVGRGAFKARIYPIPARGEKRVTLTYEEVLERENGMCEYRYGLGTGKFSTNPVDEMKITGTLSSNVPIQSIYSPTHDIDIRRKATHRAEIEFIEKGSKQESDFLLYYTVSKKDLGLNLLTFREKGEKGFFLGMISPSSLLSNTMVIAKDVVFVLDQSGSMSGEKIEQAKSALLFCLNNLNPKDRFSLITFNDEVNTHAEGMMPATLENLKLARNFVKGIEAQGGTNIHHALETALLQIQKFERTGYILFLTDGLPTVGETNTHLILANVKSKSKGSSRIFAFGVGYDVNTQFLDRLATENQGISEYVRPEENIEVKISNFYSKIANPILTDLQLDFGGITVSEVFPKFLPDLFQGSQLLIFGRYEGNGDSKVLLKGNSDGVKREFDYMGVFPVGNEKNDFIPRLWASRKIGYLVEEIRSHGENKELVDEIVQLSKKYGIITEYTSFLVEADEKLAFNDLQAEAEERITSASKPTSGGWAVNQSINARELQGSDRLSGMKSYFDADGIRKEIGGVSQRRERTFYDKKGNWVDSGFSNDRNVIQVKRFSRAYFQLMERDDTFGEYLSLGDRVLLNAGNYNAVQIEESGKEEFTEAELNKLFK